MTQCNVIKETHKFQELALEEPFEQQHYLIKELDNIITDDYNFTSSGIRLDFSLQYDNHLISCN